MGVWDAVFILSERKLRRRPGTRPFRIKRFPRRRLSVGIGDRFSLVILPGLLNCGVGLTVSCTGKRVG